MATSYERKSARVLVAAPLLLAGLLLTGCGGGSSDGASGSDPGKGGGSKPSNASDQGLAFARCMRTHGVTKFPDPSQGGGKILVDKNALDPNSQVFKDAQQACQDLRPQGQGQAAGGSVDPAKAKAWAQCVRDHGEPKFPDPQINGNQLQINAASAGIDFQDATFQAAMTACQSKVPPGAGFQIQAGGGQ